MDWCFTLNDYSEDELIRIQRDSQRGNYALIAVDRKFKNLTAYIQLTKSCHRSNLKAVLNNKRITFRVPFETPEAVCQKIRRFGLENFEVGEFKRYVTH
jgi:hypothetical protein